MRFPLSGEFPVKGKREKNSLIDLTRQDGVENRDRQTREKLQCLYENLMSNNFRRTAVLEKNINCKLKLHS